MQDQNPNTLEKLLVQLACNQNTKTMRETLANLAPLTTANLERVLRSLLDPGSFYIDDFPTLDNFEEKLRKEYQRLREDMEAWKAYWRRLNNSSTVEPEELQGALGLICFTIQLLNIASYRDQALSTTTRERLQDLLDDLTVRNWFYKIYEPTMPELVTTGQISPTQGKENPEVYQQHWEALKNENKHLTLYRVGTTSFILRFQMDLLTAE